MNNDLKRKLIFTIRVFGMFLAACGFAVLSVRQSLGWLIWFSVAVYCTVREIVREH